MTAYFLDSSAAVKRYVPELGTAWIRAVTAANTGNAILVAPVTQVEIISGVSRRAREGSIAPHAARTIRLLVDRHMQREYLVVALTADVIRRAEDALEVHPLRAYDALQLAAALASNALLIATGRPPLIFGSADARLLTIAAAEGLTTDNPNSHP